MVFRSALGSFKAMFRLKASMSRVLLVLDFDHRQRIQFFRAREYAFRIQGGSDLKRSQKAKSYIPKILCLCESVGGIIYVWRLKGVARLKSWCFPEKEAQDMQANHSRQSKNARQSIIPVLVVVASLLFTAHGIAQESSDPMAATVAQWFTMIERSFIGLADAMPAEKYGFKPTNGEFKGTRTFGEQVKHVACANFAFFNQIEKKEPPAGCATGGPSPAETKNELMTYLRESFAYAQSVLQKMTPDNALEPVSGPYGGSSTRLGITTLAVWHASDHYGQLVVYLRMNGIVPPASQSGTSSRKK